MASTFSLFGWNVPATIVLLQIFDDSDTLI